VPTDITHSKRNPDTLVREPRRSPTSAERAERRKVQEQEARIAWEEHRRKQQAIEDNTARLKALRLARESKS
jgi:hypothetical protein